MSAVGANQRAQQLQAPKYDTGVECQLHRQCPWLSVGNCIRTKQRLGGSGTIGLRGPRDEVSDLSDYSADEHNQGRYSGPDIRTV